MNKNYIIILAILIGFVLFMVPYIFRKEEIKKQVKKPIDITITEFSQSANNVNFLNKNVDITNFSFVPEEINIKKGDTVVWTEKDEVPHTVTASNKEDLLASDILSKNDTYSFTFDKVGTFNYRCKLHAAMSGVVNVTE